ncbi:hypothetical protein [Leptothoe sp. PORK10 BA2]|uniref:hypothetical protein n=1 Tax=Leptothoe sp. PORK10 BA2 TaxID=3110254 RepID=UPI002B1F4B4D|nr:hypothetical protein [Leptothoe sp. PORK10 BA2]MEA5463336.1 hypothetical protein [Leptothoe sp. PORK10 BA2]
MNSKSLALEGYWPDFLFIITWLTGPLTQTKEERSQQGKRMIGLGATALWELWQRMAAAKQSSTERLGRKRQAGGGRKKDAEVRLLATFGDVLAGTPNIA